VRALSLTHTYIQLGAHHAKDVAKWSHRHQRRNRRHGSSRYKFFFLFFLLCQRNGVIDINDEIGDTGLLGKICFFIFPLFFLSFFRCSGAIDISDVNDEIGDTGLLWTICFLFLFFPFFFLCQRNWVIDIKDELETMVFWVRPPPSFFFCWVAESWTWSTWTTRLETRIC